MKEILIDYYYYLKIMLNEKEDVTTRHSGDIVESTSTEHKKLSMEQAMIKPGGIVCEESFKNYCVYGCTHI